MTRRAWSAAEDTIVAAAPDNTTAHTELHAAGYADRTYPAVAKRRHRLTMKAGRPARQSEASDAPRSSLVAYWPTYPRAIAAALAKLAERPGLTLERYEAEKARILTAEGA